MLVIAGCEHLKKNLEHFTSIKLIDGLKKAGRDILTIDNRKLLIFRKNTWILKLRCEKEFVYFEIVLAFARKSW